MRHLRLFLLFFIISIFGFSQNTKSVNDSDINIEFIDHSVKRKQTLFTISNLYNVPIDLIKKYNHQFKGNKIFKKMVLKIPFIKTIELEKYIE